MDHWSAEVFYDGELQDYDEFVGVEPAQAWAKVVLERAGYSTDGIEWKCSDSECQLLIEPGIEARLHRKA